MIRFIIIIAICLMLVPAAYSSDKMLCTNEDAYQAEGEIGNLKTWDDLYRMFKRYAACDDAAIAEGYSDTVGRLLAKDWKHINELKKLCDSDKAFERFVYKHLDITIPADTWKIIINNATNSCPSNAKRMCNFILKAHEDIEQAIEKERGEGPVHLR